MAIGVHVKGTRRGNELEQVEAGQVAGRVVEEHVLGARIGGIDAARVLGRVPLVDGGVVLHARIAALPGSLSNFPHEVASLVNLGRFATLYLAGGEVQVPLHSAHELVGYTNG